MKKLRPHTNVMAPKPVHPTAVRTHGLFGIQFVRQHMMSDERWTPNSLTEQFKGMAELLTRRQVFKKLEIKANRKSYSSNNRNLKRQCRDGRTKLQMSMYGDNTKKIRNYLINHKDMQRLYQKMPVHLVVDNINQRTFVMRKERDRLRYRLDKRKKVYESKLLERAWLENRIKYENEFVLEEELKSRTFRKKIENSNVRLKATKTINGTYRKMLQVLQHDAIFYEPILRSLSKDIKDQASFIKHIIFLGMPAIAKFKDLSEEYRQMEDKSRKNIQFQLQSVANYKKDGLKRISQALPKFKPMENMSKIKRYVRETDSMNFLKNELEAIENTIKQVKFATLCSQAKEIYPRIKSQVDNNEKLYKMISNNILGHHSMGLREKRAEVLQGVLINNLTEEQIIRQETIKNLQEDIAREDEFEAKTLAHMKNRADVFVLLRYTLWNLNDVLRHVDRPAKAMHVTYPNSYLKLPLLKFEMLTMRACPPELYDENIDSIMRVVQKKVHVLMSHYKTEQSREKVKAFRNEYHHVFVENMETDDLGEGGDSQKHIDIEDELQDTRTNQNVPNRKQIKMQSAKMVEEFFKRDE